MSLVRLFVNILLLGLCCGFGTAQAVAQSDYPSRPVQIVVPFTAGGGGDILVRAIADELKAELHQSVVVENVPGAGGEIAAAQMARSAPDGYRMIFATPGPFSYAPNVHLTKPPYDPLRDFAPVTTLGVFSSLLVVHQSIPVHSLKELTAYAKANPGKLAYGTSNSTGVATMAQLVRSAGIEMLHIPYKGESQALPDLMTGRIQLMIVAPSTMEQLQGNARPIVALGPHRAHLFPAIPTAVEEGFTGIKIVQWLGFAMPGGTPKPIVERASQALNKVFAKPEIQKRATLVGTIIGGSTPEQMSELLKSQLEAWREAVKLANLPTD